MMMGVSVRVMLIAMMVVVTIMVGMMVRVTVGAKPAPYGAGLIADTVPMAITVWVQGCV